jgi:hypothetical protein
MIKANFTYINIVLDTFNTIVSDVCTFGQLQEQTDILAMRVYKDCNGSVVKTSEFKVCMLASMRSLIPKRWDTRHEKAWGWLWESIHTELYQSLPKPKQYEQVVHKFLEGMDENDKRKLGLDAFKKLFEKDALAENFFKQSNERLIYISLQALEFSDMIYQEPSKVYKAVQGLGLKHIMYRVDPKYFAIYVECMSEELRNWTDDENVVAGIHWSLTVVASTMARVVDEGSTPILCAALDNNVKSLKAELAAQPRGARVHAVLNA